MSNAPLIESISISMENPTNPTTPPSTASIFLKEKGVPEVSIKQMLQRCSKLSKPEAMERLHSNWSFLENQVGIPKRKLPSTVLRCPQLLVLSLHNKLRPVADFLAGLGASREDLASAVLSFPNVFVYSVEEKLCPLLGFLQGAGVPEGRLAKVFLSCPRLVSYSIGSKLDPTIRFLQDLGIKKDENGMGKLLVRWPHIFGYSVETRIRPTVSFLENLGLSNVDICRTAVRFPHVLCRNADKILKPNVEFLQSEGFNTRQICSLVAGYPPILLANVENSLKPKIVFLVSVMGKKIDDVVAYPSFFAHSLGRKIEPRYRKLKEDGVEFSLEGMLSCNQKKFSEGNLIYGQNPVNSLADLSL